MTRAVQELAARYGEALTCFLAGAEESALLAAYELGREALEEGLDLLDLGALHREAIAALIETSSGGVEAAAVARRAGEFFSETLAPYEMVRRGYREANVTLRRLSENLEEQVARRTRELEGSLAALRRVHEQRRRLLERLVSAQEEERRRIAEDIHDDSIQVMTAARMRLETLRRKLAEGDHEEFGKLGEDVGLAIGRLRHLVFELRPPALDRDGLAAALRERLEQGEEQFGLSYHLEVRISAEPPSDVRTILYRIAQEALSNVRRHARATRVDVEVEERDAGVLVRIADDGTGFAPREIPGSAPGHLGLGSMRERAELAGGWCRIESSPGQGATVEIWVPVSGP